MAMTDQQITAMNNYANGLAEAIFNEMAPIYFPPVMKEEDKEETKQYYKTLARAFYKFNNGLSE